MTHTKERAMEQERQKLYLLILENAPQEKIQEQSEVLDQYILRSLRSWKEGERT